MCGALAIVRLKARPINKHIKLSKNVIILEPVKQQQPFISPSPFSVMTPFVLLRKGKIVDDGIQSPLHPERDDLR